MSTSAHVITEDMGVVAIYRCHQAPVGMDAAITTYDGVKSCRWCGMPIQLVRSVQIEEVSGA